MIARINSDNLIVTDYIQSQDTYIRKYDKFGNFLWAKTSFAAVQSNYEKPIGLIPKRESEIKKWKSRKLIEKLTG